MHHQKADFLVTVKILLNISKLKVTNKRNLFRFFQKVQQNFDLHVSIIEKNPKSNLDMSSYLMLLKNRPFILLRISYGIAVGSSMTFTTLLRQLSAPFFCSKWTSNEFNRLMAQMSFTRTMCGFIGSLASGALLDRFGYFKLAFILDYLMILVFLILFCIRNVEHNPLLFQKISNSFDFVSQPKKCYVFKPCGSICLHGRRWPLFQFDFFNFFSIWLRSDLPSPRKYNDRITVPNQPLVESNSNASYPIWNRVLQRISSRYTNGIVFRDWDDRGITSDWIDSIDIYQRR